MRREKDDEAACRVGEVGTRSVQGAALVSNIAQQFKLLKYVQLNIDF